MNSIVKSQLIKRLSRYIKNLSPDKITLNLFNDDANCLENIELDEIVLMDLLELPTWLRLTSAHCNRLTFNIKLANIKTLPIILIEYLCKKDLDVVRIVVETCEELRSPSIPTKLKYFTSEKYGFINKIIDGITVRIKNTYVVLNSPIFKTEIEIFGIVVQSKSPLWQKCSLPESRIKNSKGSQVLIFKEVEWHCLRIEANSTSIMNLSPLKLLTESASCRIVIKKRISDSQILNSRLVFILEEVVWILTDSQLKAAALFVNSLVALIKKSAAQTHKIKAARKLDIFSENENQLNETNRNVDDLFSLLDVAETSHHFVAKRINFHFSDESEGRSSYPNLKNGAAFTINLERLTVDYYPYHVGNEYNTYWFCYNEILLPKEAISNQRSANILMKSHIIIRLHDFLINKVSFSVNTSDKNQFISSDRSCHKMLKLFDQKTILQAEFVYYYYPDNIALECPIPKFVTKIYPVKIDVDFETLLWLNSFASNILKGATLFQMGSQESHFFNVQVEICLVSLKIVVENKYQHECNENPENLTIQLVNIQVTNNVNDSNLEKFHNEFKLSHQIPLELPNTCLMYMLNVYRIDIDFVYKRGLTISLIYPIVRPDSMCIVWDKDHNNMYGYWMNFDHIEMLINQYQYWFLVHFWNDMLQFLHFIRIDQNNSDLAVDNGELFLVQEFQVPNLFLYVILSHIQCSFYFNLCVNDLYSIRCNEKLTNGLNEDDLDGIYSFLNANKTGSVDETNSKSKSIKYINAFVKINSERDRDEDIEIATDVTEESECNSESTKRLVSLFCAELNRINFSTHINDLFMECAVLNLQFKQNHSVNLCDYINNYQKPLEMFTSKKFVPNILPNSNYKIQFKMENNEMAAKLINLDFEIMSSTVLEFKKFWSHSDPGVKTTVFPINIELKSVNLIMTEQSNKRINIANLSIFRSSDDVVHVLQDFDQNLTEENRILKQANEQLKRKILELENQLSRMLT